MTFNSLILVEYCWLAIGLVWLAGLAFGKRIVRRQPSTARLFQFGLAIFGFALVGSKWFDRGWMAVSFLPPTELAHRFSDSLGLGFAIAGSLFAIWARIALGGNWSATPTVKDSHELVVRGPYSLSRHPIYSGLLTITLGTVLVVGEWRSFVGFFVVVLALILKMCHEEQLMTQQFPESYPRYRQQVKALIPGLL
jgi:protein-S-isoprenylcysteine O-methyltransferase Ste14